MSTAITDWYPTRDQITESGDQFLGWSTRILIGIANRVTPQNERDNWVATTTEGVWEWNSDDEMWQLRVRDEQTGGTVVKQAYGDDLIREFVIEQLDRYGIDRAAVNRMKS
jgi:hypothetical protein